MFYIYAYLDPTKTGPYIYGDLIFDYEPFYIGKGHGDRSNDHLKYKDNINTFKQRKIDKLLKNGHSPIIIKINDNIEDEEYSFELEKTYISIIGRRVIKNGPLCNIAEGGRGGKTLTEPWNKGKTYDELFGEEKSNIMKEAVKLKNLGKNLSSETRKKISDGNKNKNVTDETCKKISTALIGKKLSEETKRKISNTLKMMYKQNPSLGKKVSADHTEKSLSQEHKNKISTSLKGKPYKKPETHPCSRYWHWLNDKNEEVFIYSGNYQKFCTKEKISIRKTKVFDNKEECIKYVSEYKWKVYYSKTICNHSIPIVKI